MLRGCTIGGDARLVFNPRPGTGPSIKAELAKIGGRLDIMPYPHRHDEDSFLLDIDEFARNEKRAGEERVLIQKRSQYSPPSAWRALTTRSPHIDLRSAKAVAFCHPPPAWPRQGGLSLTGFKYGRTANIGPLAPHPYSIDYNEHGLPVSPLRRSNRDDLRLCLAIVFTSFLLVSSVLLVMPDSPVYRGSMLFSQEGAHGYMRQIDLVGRINLFLTFLVLSVCLWLEVLRNFAPRTDQSSPMALVYLKLQQVSRNRYRTPGTIYWALDPYVTATRALREEGRYLSAHAVEIDRLRQRYSMLSLRHHFLAKLLLGVVDRVSEYGFNISRTFVLLVLTLLAASMLAHASITVGALESKEAKPDSPVGLVNVVTGNARLDSVPTTAPPPPDVANEEFVSLLYAIDTVVPFLDFHQRDRWQAKIPKVHHLPNWAYLIWPDLFAAIGLFLTTIGVTSLATRMESVLARTED